MAEFHFIRPWWLLGALTVLIVGVIAWRYSRSERGWARIIPPHLQQALFTSTNSSAQRRPLLAVICALLLTCVALAGPTWQRLPQPVYNLQAGSVVIMDMSLSVYSTDVTPNRLDQMRFKATDLVRDKLDGEIGLIAYAGDAFTISPLTSDGSNLGNLIRALSPEIMPSPGSYPIRALNLADQLLRDAGHAEGDIFWLTDGIEQGDVTDVNNFISRTNHRINVLAVGTSDGAPITLPDGMMLRDRNNNIVIPRLTTGSLESLANRSGGRFTVVQADQSDIDYLASIPPRTREGEASELQAGDQWHDQGPWLIPLILIILLPLVRRGVIVSCMAVVLLSSNLIYSPRLLAAERDPLNWQEKLWQTPYQQADQALRKGDYEAAAAIAEDPWQRGTANYRAGNYDQALVDFSQLDSAEGFYNQGNALMQMERYDEAVNAYDAALKRRPNWQAAQQNRALAEQMQQQQEQQQAANDQQDQQGAQQQSPNQQGQQGDSNNTEQNETGEQGEQSSSSPSDKEQEQQEAQQEATESQQQQPGTEGEQQQPLNSVMGDPSSEELQQQMQQWLNRIDDNPAELLRQKMRYEAQQRRRQGSAPGVEKQW